MTVRVTEYMTMQTETETPASNAFSYHTVLSALRCWWKVVIPLGIAFAGIAAGVLFFLHKPLYTAQALLMIKESRPHILQPGMQFDSKRFIQNQMVILRSKTILGKLAGNAEIVTTPELVKEIDIAVALGKQLNIRSQNSSDIYAVSFTSESPEKAELIVREVVNAYLAYNDQFELQVGREMVDLLKQQSEERSKEMARLRDDVRRDAIKLTGVDPFRLGNDEKDLSKSKNPLAELQSDIIKHQIDQDILAARIKVEEQRQAERAEPSEKAIEREIGLQPSYLSQQARIELLEKKVADYQKLGKNAANVPAFKQLQTDLADERQALDKLKASLHDDIKDALARQQAAEDDANLKKLKDEYAIADVRLRVLNDKFKEGMGAAKQYTGDSLNLEFLKAKLEQVTAIHEAINNRILGITTEQKAPEQVTLVEPVTRPIRPDEFIPWKKIGFGAGLAFLFPLGACVAWEHFFRRVSTRSQVERIQQLTVVGEVTALPTRTRRSSHGRRSVERDMLLYEESVDSLRTYLSLTEAGRDVRVIAVTSAVSGEGKTSLASQLAASIARATREPTLLIDGDLRSPDVHNIFELEVGPGVAEVLQNDCPLEEAIETSISERLHVFTAGRLNSNPHQLLGGENFVAMMERLRATYRHIVIDTPPILSASESLVIARAADSAILCMRRDHSRLDQSHAAFSRMVAAGVNVAGAVLNGIPIRQYAYHYGSYVYGEKSSTPRISG